MLHEEIGKIGAKFVKMVEYNLENAPIDIHSIGAKILTNYKTYQSYLIKNFNKLIEGQDIDYVIKYICKI